MPGDKDSSWKSEEARTVPARTALSSNKDHQFPSYEKGHTKLTLFFTLFLTVGTGNIMPSIQFINIIFHIYSSTSRIIMLVCST